LAARQTDFGLTQLADDLFRGVSLRSIVLRTLYSFKKPRLILDLIVPHELAKRLGSGLVLLPEDLQILLAHPTGVLTMKIGSVTSIDLMLTLDPGNA